MPTLSIILFAVAGLIFIVSSIWMIVLAFQRKLAWGVALLLPTLLILLLPFAMPNLAGPTSPVLLSLRALSTILYIAFVIVAWEEARRPFFWSLTGVLVLLMAIFSVPGSQLSLNYLTSRVQAGDGSAQGTFEKLRTLVSPDSAGADSTTNRRNSNEPPPTVFKSKLPVSSVPPGQPEPPQPGIFYLTERVTTSTATGFKAGNPGEKVTLLRRLPGDRMQVTVGNADFTVKGSQVTDDVAAARELERQDFVSRGGRL